MARSQKQIDREKVAIQKAEELKSKICYSEIKVSSKSTPKGGFEYHRSYDAMCFNSFNRVAKIMGACPRDG